MGKLRSGEGKSLAQVRKPDKILASTPRLSDEVPGTFIAPSPPGKREPCVRGTVRRDSLGHESSRSKREPGRGGERLGLRKCALPSGLIS